MPNDAGVRERAKRAAAPRGPGGARARPPCSADRHRPSVLGVVPRRSQESESVGERSRENLSDEIHQGSRCEARRLGGSSGRECVRIELRELAPRGCLDTLEVQRVHCEDLRARRLPCGNPSAPRRGRPPAS
jgi:hypothetical protein